jgi:hypothetical protein
MSNITIGRYDADSTLDWSGWVEGEDSEGNSWILYLDAQGRPTTYWAKRDPSGAVVGDPIHLS